MLGVSQLYYDAFEVVVVGDPAAMAVVADTPFADRIKACPFDAPNISAARNLGIARAGADIVAFLDDDAVPEPTWLTNLVDGMQATGSDLAGGYVRGRNGISFQWQARSIDNEAIHRDLSVQTADAEIPDPGSGRAVKTEGTNMAIRRGALVALGGFDQAFAFYLDESDLNLRAASQGMRTALVPLAQVHHGSAPSALRTSERAPRDLFEIGASLSVYLRKHARPDRIQPALADAREAERARLIRHMVRGSAVPGDIEHLLSRFDAGVVEGETRKVGAVREFGTQPSFLAFRTGKERQSHQTLFAGVLGRRAVRNKAREARVGGAVISLFEFSPTALFHKVRFTDDGIWRQSGGLFGKSERTEPLFSLWTKSKRAQKEADRVAALRKTPDSRRAQ